VGDRAGAAGELQNDVTNRHRIATFTGVISGTQMSAVVSQNSQIVPEWPVLLWFCVCRQRLRGRPSPRPAMISRCTSLLPP
jgi:hypothetical protein